MKRRKFIKHSLYTGVAFSFGCANPTRLTDSKNKLGVALVGLGYYSRDLLAPALQLTEHCYLAGIVTGSPEKIPVWQKEYGIKNSNVYNYENMHTIADNDEIDVVYVVVPTALHAKYSIIAANAGKHVWCEKPMGLNVAQCQSIIDTCDKNKVKLSIGYRMQHEPNTQTVISYASSKPFGSTKAVKAWSGYSGGTGTGWRFQKNMGGGAMYDMGVYAVNAIRYVTGRMPSQVMAAKHSTQRPKFFHEVDETTEFQLAFDDGLEAVGKTSVGENINLLRVDCERGWYELSPMQSYNGVQGKTSEGKQLNVYIENQQARQMDDDALAIINNTDVLVPGIEGLKDIRIIEAIFKSAQEGRAIKI